MRIIRKITGLPYETAMLLRRNLYERGVLKSGAASVPVICVGNITTGGTGKTPMVAWVVKKLAEKGKTPAILTRGYKSAGGKSDEAMLLERLTGATVIVNPDRVKGAADAVAGGANVLVMDDGFQHLRLRRDVDIVLVDASNPFGGGGALPLGRLREGLSALRRADAIVITRSDAVSPQQLDKLKKILAGYANCPIATAVHKPSGLVDLSGNRLGLDELRGKTAWTFCGLGNPGAFEKTLERCGVKILGSGRFSDHTRYDSPAVERIVKNFASSGAELLVTTRKDGVKLGPGDFGKTNVWQLDIEMELTDNTDAIEKILFSQA